MPLTGLSLLGAAHGAATDATFYAYNPATGQPLPPAYHGATVAETDVAAALAAQANRTYAQTDGRTRAAFLRSIADNLAALEADFVARATQETGLPAARIQSELGRTCGQMRLFATVAEEGSWVEARLDSPDAHRRPLPKPDVRSMLQPLGPVAVFGASNFPLAYSVAGGDTASALAAGCPVIAVGHYAHPGAAELAGGAIRTAVAAHGLPEGVFSLLYGAGNDVGQHLVQHPNIAAAGFTGSRRGGLALLKLAQNRPVPIPFYAEMSSINPVFITPRVLRAQTDSLAQGLAASMTGGVGQFCTQPGLVFVPEIEATQEFIATLQNLLTQQTATPMLTAGIAAAYRTGVADYQQTAGVGTVFAGAMTDNDSRAAPVLLRVSLANWLDEKQHESLTQEVFGPATLLITYPVADDKNDKGLPQNTFTDIAARLEGQLTATLYAAPEDLAGQAEFVQALSTRVGRIIFNGWPTGLEVGPAIVHGGPFPATSDGRTTSVGSRAIKRWARAVCYQNAPAQLLPPSLQDGNPLGLWRMIDGQTTR